MGETVALLASSSAREQPPVQLPAQPQLPAASSMLPQPAACRGFLLRSLPGVLAVVGMLALLVMSVVVLWPPGNGSSTPVHPLQQPPSLNLPRKFLDR